MTDPKSPRRSPNRVTIPVESESPAPAADSGASAGEFDAVSAAAELAEALGTPDFQPAAAPQADAGYAATLEGEVLELSGLLEKRDALLEKRDARIAELEQQIDDEIAKARARADRDAQVTVRRKRESLLKEMLEIVDDLDRAIAAAREMDHNPAVVDGVELVRRGVLKRLADQGVMPQNAAGQVFDPNLHEAVAAVPASDPEQAGRIVGVVRTGYNIDDRVLRAAQVAVGKAQ